MRMKQNNFIKTIELFAGVGGFRIGLENIKNYNNGNLQQKYNMLHKYMKNNLVGIITLMKIFQK